MPPEETDTTPEAATTETPTPQKGNGIPSPRESFEAAQKKLGGAEASDTEDTPVDPTTAEKVKRAAKKPEADASLATGELEQLKALATKLGLALEDGKVTTTERVNLRQERSENLRAIAQAEKDAIAKVQAARGEWEPKIKRVEDLEAASKAGDYDAIAKILGFDDWNKLQDDQIQRLADPNYKRVRELEERLKREDEEKAKAKEEGERQQATQAELAAQANYKRGLQTTMAGSGDPLVKAMADMPNFVNAVFRVQQQHWQESGGRDTISAESAAKFAPPGGMSLEAELKTLYERLTPVFGKTVAAPAGTPEKPKPKTPTIPQPPPAARARTEFRPGRGFTEEQKERMAAALKEDIRRERTGT